MKSRRSRPTDRSASLFIVLLCLEKFPMPQPKSLLALGSQFDFFHSPVIFLPKLFFFSSRIYFFRWEVRQRLQCLIQKVGPLLIAVRVASSDTPIFGPSLFPSGVGLWWISRLCEAQIKSPARAKCYHQFKVLSLHGLNTVLWFPSQVTLAILYVFKAWHKLMIIRLFKNIILGFSLNSRLGYSCGLNSSNQSNFDCQLCCSVMDHGWGTTTPTIDPGNSLSHLSPFGAL